MKYVTAGLLILSLGVASKGAGIPPDDAKKLEALATAQISRDFRIVFHEEKDAKIWGGDGDAYVGQVQMNVYSRGYDEGGPKITDHWININRQYEIFKNELKDPNPRLFDNEHQCME